MLESSYSRIAKAVAALATSDPALLQHLADMPDKFELSLHATSLNDDAYTRQLLEDGQQMSIPHVPFGRETAGLNSLTVKGKCLLQQQTADEVVMGMAKVLAHPIANHIAEERSCGLIIKVAAGAVALALGLAGVSIFYSLAAASYFFFFSSIVEPVWLHWKQMYEADALGAAISIAAGSNPDSVLTSMQRPYLADASTPEQTYLQRACAQRMRHTLVKLQVLLPHSQIPQEPFTDSTGMQHVVKAAAAEVSTATNDVQVAYQQGVHDLQHCLATQLVGFRTPWGVWGRMPHQLDRIHHMQKLLGSNSFSNVQLCSKHGGVALGAVSEIERYVICSCLASVEDFCRYQATCPSLSHGRVYCSTNCSVVIFVCCILS